MSCASSSCTVVNTNLPVNFSSSLSYDANNAYLNLTLNYVLGSLEPAQRRRRAHEFLQCEWRHLRRVRQLDTGRPHPGVG